MLHTHVIYLYVCVCVCTLCIEPWALHVLVKYSTTELYPQLGIWCYMVHEDLLWLAWTFFVNYRSYNIKIGSFILVTLECSYHCGYNSSNQRTQERTVKNNLK